MHLEESKIKKYKKLCDFVLEGNRRRIYNEKYYNLVTELLDWNFELYTVWNYRKVLILKFLFKGLKENDLKEKHQIFTEELHFVLDKLRKSPKSYWIWNHRIWCLKLDKLSDWNIEIGLTNKFLQADQRNFHVWAYRRFIIDSMKKDDRVEQSSEAIDFDEFKFTTKMINKDISNYSAWHNRSKLVIKLFTNSPSLEHISTDEDPKMLEYLRFFNGSNQFLFLKKELDLVKTAIYTDPDDSSVWFYMKWLFSDYFLTNIDMQDMINLIKDTVNAVKELNEFELDDNEAENKWCLIFVAYLYKRLHSISKNEVDLEEFESILQRLEKLDPMRRSRYKEFHI